MLRALLKKFPRWKKGHLSLGLAELWLELMSDGPRNPRAVAAIRVSTQAVRELLGGKRRRRRINLEADFLTTMLIYFDRRYADALEKYEELLRPENSVMLSEPVYLALFEYAGASAMAIGETAKAKIYFGRIPERKLTAEIEQAKKYLEVSTAPKS